MAPSYITAIFCPTLGTVICTIMWLTPLQSILKARRLHSLGTLNPIPFGVIVLNCIGWSGYGIMSQDFFIYFSNSPGILLGLLSYHSIYIFILLIHKKYYLFGIS